MSIYQIPMTFKASPQLKAWLTKEAKIGYRSVSAEVAMRLERQMTASQQSDRTDVKQAAELHQKSIADSAKGNAPVVAATEASYSKVNP